MAWHTLVPLDQWRCKKCGKNADEGATPRYENGNANPSGTCLGCYREQQRQQSARANVRERMKIGRGAQPDRAFRFTRAELRRRYLSHAEACERRAAEIERRDPDVAYRLRDQAKDWRALAAKPYAH